MKTIFSIASGAAAAVILIGGVASAQTASFSGEMGIGARGSDVTSLQTWLESNGYYNGPVTGYYGTLTRAGVENYQSAKGISATGYVGPLTLAALNGSAYGSTTVTSNSTELAQLQNQLNSLLAQIQTLQAGTSITTTTNGTVPVASNVSLQTNQNLGANGTLGATSGSSPYTFAITASPIHGTITSFNSTTGAFTYMPSSNYIGSDSFTYTVRNSSGTSAPMIVSLNVGTNSGSTSTGGTPSGQSFTLSATSGNSVNGMLGANGSGTFTYAIVTPPQHGTVNSFTPATGAFTYTPTTGYHGSDSFTYTVNNGSSTSGIATVTIND